MRTKPPIWLWAVPIFSVGLLAPVPTFVIALKAQTARAWAWFGGFAVAAVVGIVLIGSQPEGSDNAWTNLGLLIVLANLVAALSYSGVVGKGILWGQAPLPVLGYAPAQTFPPPPSQHSMVPPPPPPPSVDQNSAAIAGVRAARQKRSDARAIAQRDPQMARDLRIGRPDLPRHYDDGGLVDINSAPAAVFVEGLSMSETQASQLVDVRHSLGKFKHPDDLMHLGGLDQRQYDEVRDRIVLL